MPTCERFYLFVCSKAHHMLKQALEWNNQYDHPDYIAYKKALNYIIFTTPKKGQQPLAENDIKNGQFYSIDIDRGENIKVTMPVYKSVVSELEITRRKIIMLQNVYSTARDKKIAKDLKEANDYANALEYFKEFTGKEYIIEKQPHIETVSEVPSLSIKTKTKTKRKTKVKSPEYEHDDHTSPGLPIKKTKTKTKTKRKIKTESTEDIFPKENQQVRIKKSALNQIINNIPLDRFKFKTAEECNSKSSSKPFYMSKDDILKIIASDENIEKEFPSNYKKLKKEELCTILFRKN